MSTPLSAGEHQTGLGGDLHTGRGGPGSGHGCYTELETDIQGCCHCGYACEFGERWRGGAGFH